MGGPTLSMPPPKTPPPAPDPADAQVRQASQSARRRQMQFAALRQTFLAGPRAGGFNSRPLIGSKSLIGA